MMSREALAWQKAPSLPTSSIRFVLIALARDCDRRGGMTDLSNPDLEQITGHKTRTVWAAIRDLESLGLLKRTSRKIGHPRLIEVTLR